VSAFIDARTVAEGTVLEPDLAIVGGGPAGISMALRLAHTRVRMVLLESGGMSFDAKVQQLYDGAETGAPYLPLDSSRVRYLGGGTNLWGGWCRPMDAIEFEQRDWMPHSGWPIERHTLTPYYPAAQSLCEAGPWLYEEAERWSADQAPVIALGEGGVATRWFQFSKMRGSPLPTHFGERYADDLKHVPNLATYLHANVTKLGLAPGGGALERLDVATLSGRRFTVKPKCAVLALGAVETARLLLASNDVMKAGVGNGSDNVGRYFADHPIPRDIATLVLFAGQPAPFYPQNQLIQDAIMRAGLFPSERYRRAKHMLDCSITIEDEATLDDLGKAALAETAAALGVDAGSASVHSLGGGCEVTPDPERRLVLTHERDALGMPKLKLQMRIADADFAHFRDTLKELGRQLLASRVGMLRLNRKERGEWLDGLDWGNHHMGTTRMSADPKTGVVDADLKVHGLSNLYVAGSSVYPSYGAVNPTLSIVALALRLADHVKGKLG
jgi:choline dehydrogenase-like flavoprotein